MLSSLSSTFASALQFHASKQDQNVDPKLSSKHDPAINPSAKCIPVQMDHVHPVSVLKKKPFGAVSPFGLSNGKVMHPLMNMFSPALKERTLQTIDENSVLDEDFRVVQGMGGMKFLFF